MRFRLTLLWGRTGYRPVARLLHRFNLHHTRQIGPMEDGAVIHKCEWCGVSRVDHTMESLRAKMAALNHTLEQGSNSAPTPGVSTPLEQEE